MATPALPSLRIIYFTSVDAQTANGIIQLLEALGQQVLLVVVTPGPRARPTETYKDIVANIRPGMDVLVTSHIKRLPALLRGLEPDLIFVAGFPWRLPPDLITLPRLGSINTHPALLPRYRGPDPMFWQLMNDEPETGLTTHWIEPDFDTGPILAQAAMPILPDDDQDSIFARISSLAPGLVVQALTAVAAGEPGRPQPVEGASYAPLRTAADRVLDWNKPAARLRNQVRAWGPEGALATLDGRQWIVKRASVEDGPAGRPPGAHGPGRRPWPGGPAGANGGWVVAVGRGRACSGRAWRGQVYYHCDGGTLMQVRRTSEVRRTSFPSLCSSGKGCTRLTAQRWVGAGARGPGRWAGPRWRGDRRGDAGAHLVVGQHPGVEIEGGERAVPGEQQQAHQHGHPDSHWAAGRGREGVNHLEHLPHDQRPQPGQPRRDPGQHQVQDADTGP